MAQKPEIPSSNSDEVVYHFEDRRREVRLQFAERSRFRRAQTLEIDYDGAPARVAFAFDAKERLVRFAEAARIGVAVNFQKVVIDPLPESARRGGKTKKVQVWCELINVSCEDPKKIAALTGALMKYVETLGDPSGAAAALEGGARLVRVRGPVASRAL